MQAWRLDTDLAVRVSQEDAAGDEQREPSVDDVVRSIPVYDERGAPDPFGEVPEWALG